MKSPSGKLNAADLYDVVVEALFAVGWSRFVKAGVLKYLIQCSNLCILYA